LIHDSADTGFYFIKLDISDPYSEMLGVLSKWAVWTHTMHKAHLTRYVHESESRWYCLVFAPFTWWRELLCPEP